jgi:hypothetical protein
MSSLNRCDFKEEFMYVAEQRVGCSWTTKAAENRRPG